MASARPIRSPWARCSWCWAQPACWPASGLRCARRGCHPCRPCAWSDGRPVAAARLQAMPADSNKPPAPARVLVVDDQPDVREALRMLLESEGYAVVAAASPEEAAACLRGDDFSAVLADMNYTRDTTSGQEGLELVQHIAANWPGLPVIVMTAWASVELAVEAMRLGAADFIEKPWQNARLLAVLESRIALASSRRSERRLGAANALLLEE